MSQLLQSLLKQIGDPDRQDLLAIKPALEARLQAIKREERHQLLAEVTEIRQGLSHADGKSWYAHHILFQLLCALCYRVVDTEEQRALKEEIKRGNGGRNGSAKAGHSDANVYPSPGCLIPEEVIIRHPIHELLDRDSHAASPAFE